MPRKAPVRKSDHSKDEKVRRRTQKKCSRGSIEPEKLYRETERDEPRTVKRGSRQIARNSRDGFSDTTERSRYPQNRVRPRRPVQERKVREGQKRPVQQPVAKRPGILVISFLGNLVFYGITIGIIFMALMFSFSSKSTASIFGYRFYTVLTNSMVPQENGPKGGFYAGDIVIVKLTDGKKVKKDDIVTFAVGDGSRYLTHRMVERKDELNGEKGDYLVTKGDANKNNDPPITADRVLGKVIMAVPKVGSITEFVREEFWACLVCILSLYGFFLVLKAYLFSSQEEVARKDRGKRRPVYER